MRRHLKAIFAIAPLIFVAIFAALVLFLPPQSREIYRSIAEAMALQVSGSLKEPIICFVSLTVLALGLWTATLIVGVRVTPQALRRIDWLAGPVAVLPILGAAGGVASARLSADSRSLNSFRDALAQVRLHEFIADHVNAALAASMAQRFAANAIGFNAILAGSCAILLAWAAILGLVLIIPARSSGRLRLSRFPIGLSLLILSAISASLVALFTIPAARVSVPQALTPVGVLCAFFLILSLWMALLTVSAKLTGWPILSTLVCAAILFAAFDRNDDHRVRTSESLPKSTQAPDNAVDGFKRWLHTRSDMGSYTQQKYPIYVIAAQGGGIYAAYDAAAFLGDIEDECPNFAHHIFAISGVSGGSVGAAVFAALVRNWETAPSGAIRAVKACDGSQPAQSLFTDAATEILSRDYLSPVEAGLLFPDFIQQLLPWPVPAFDRARALEYGLEQGWDIALAQKRFQSLHQPGHALANPLRQSFLSLWNPDIGSSVPALVLNTTEVYFGYRRVVSSFRFQSADPFIRFVPLWSGSPVSTVDPDAPLTQMPLSTAAFLSARFPWVTPAASFKDVGDNPLNQVELEKIRVVDGGYFENSGIVTAMDVVDGIANAIDSEPDLAPYRNKVEIDLITLNSKEYATSDFYGLSELFSPIDAMLSTRDARAPVETARAQQLVFERSTTSNAGGTTGASVGERFIRFDLNWLGYPLPLGWRLSTLTEMIIDNQLGSRQACGAETPTELAKSSSLSGDCLRQLIFLQLAGG